MNRSVEPAFTLRKKQLEQEKLAMQIADLERSIARPADEGIRRYSVFEFFKGFLKASVIVTAVLAVPSYIYCGISNFLYKSGNPAVRTRRSKRFFSSPVFSRCST